MYLTIPKRLHFYKTSGVFHCLVPTIIQNQLFTFIPKEDFVNFLEFISYKTYKNRNKYLKYFTVKYHQWQYYNMYRYSHHQSLCSCVCPLSQKHAILQFVSANFVAMSFMRNICHATFLSQQGSCLIDFNENRLHFTYMDKLDIQICVCPHVSTMISLHGDMKHPLT